jgi:hypothetical protein
MIREAGIGSWKDVTPRVAAPVPLDQEVNPPEVGLVTVMVDESVSTFILFENERKK